MVIYPDYWEKLDRAGRELLLRLVMLPPPVDLDLVIASASGSAVEALKVIEPMLAANLLAVYEPQGIGFYFFTKRETPLVLIRQLPARQVEAAALALTAHIEASFPDDPRQWLTLAHLHHLTGVSLPRWEILLKAAAYCQQTENHEATRIYLELATRAIQKNSTSHQARQAYARGVSELLSPHNETIPYAEQKAALELARSFCSEDTLAARLELASGWIASTDGDFGAADRHFTQAWRIAEQLADRRLLLQIALAASEMLFQRGLVADAVEKYEQALGNLEDLPDDPGTLQSCARLGWFYAITGNMARGIGLIQAVQDRARQLALSEIMPYADLMKALAYLEMRHHEEAEILLNQILQKPPELLGLYIPWAANAAMAYCLWRRGDLDGCFRLQKKGYDSARRLGWTHQRGPWNFEYMESLEEAGLVHPKMNCAREITHLLAHPDIHMQGVALRVRAHLELKAGGDEMKARQDLERSIDLLRRAGARLELARSQVALSRLLERTGETERMRSLLSEAWQAFSAVDEALFPGDLRRYLEPQHREDLVVRTVVEVGDTLGAEREEEKLLNKIIELSLRLTRAERGAFFLLDREGVPRLAASRNLDEAMVTSSQFRPILNMIRRVAASGRRIIHHKSCSTGTGGPERHGEGWTLCGPVKLRDRVLGVAYLESGLAGSALDRHDVALLTAIGSQVAVALDNMQAYAEIARLRDQLEEENRFLLKGVEGSYKMGTMVGDTPAMRRVFQQIAQVASTESTVLITGETGVGKELVARSIHRLSPRAKGAFIAVDTSLPEELFASELFGHERGAFTGAIQARRGRFELARGGTVFLDDVQNLSLGIQANLLRVIQEREFTRLGGKATIQADFRLIAASNQVLETMVEQELFRADLFYRLNVFPIVVPPLRDRKEDIPLLVKHFLEHFSQKMGKDIKGISNGNLRRLMEYHWPGNVRELKHVIERAVILCAGDFLRHPILEDQSAAGAGRHSFLPLKEMERRYILTALEACDWKVSGPHGAASLLGLNPSTLYSKIRRLGLKRTPSYSETG